MLDGGDKTPYLSRLMARLAGMGVAVVYVGDPEWKDFDALRSAGVVCEALRVRHKLDLPARWRVRRLLDEHGIQILHTIMGRDAYVGIKARRRRPVKVLARRGAYTPISRIDPADRAVYGRRGADRFLVVSRDLARHMVARGLDESRVTTVYTGVWSDELCPVPRDLRAEHGIGGDALLLALVGNLRPVKGFDYLLDALALLQGRGVPFHLLIAGDGYEGVREAMRAKGVADRITLLGYVSDVMTVTPNVDCVVFPSRIDALPRAAIEATVVGTPVVGTHVGGIPEILDDGRAGVLVDRDDPASMAAALERAASDPASLRALGEDARERNRDLFSIDRCARRHLELYEEALA